MALVNPKIRADVVEISEFPYLAQRYNVMAVPMTVINNRVQFEGALPEKAFLGQVLRAAGLTSEG